MLCPICHENMRNTSILSCNHRYHTTCIERWRDVNNTCPECREPITNSEKITNMQILCIIYIVLVFQGIIELIKLFITDL